VKFREAYRSWADQHLDEARWVAWLWIPAALVMGLGVWTWLEDRGASPGLATAPVAVPAAGDRATAALRTENEYPANPAVWAAAAARLDPARPEAAALLRDAGLSGGPTSAVAAAASPLAPAIARLWNGGIPAALAWLEPKPLATADPALRAFRADLLARRRLMPELRAALEAGAWGPADADTLDLAFAAADARDRQHPELERDLWDAALELCSSDPAKFRLLERLSLGLGLDAEILKTFQTETRSPAAELATVRRQAVWAARQGSLAWAVALDRWKEAAPAEAAAYAASLQKRKGRAP
jgi:hypothetical protein